ncbi:ankyrin repeat-containing protein [Toxoplasma gondii RUB]|uniref:Ankyrin repeat-containing protein n=1 Tax=Toxoplasma gondii RUB TaxID=935652 RepID=A0A086LTI1_TOXGO|nr:ankyrin repeat-containing protein [Toxoplasma gondii RUB]
MAAPAAFSAARRAKVEEMVDDFIYAARVGDAADLETTLAALKAEFEEPHSLCRFLAETGNREKKAKRNDSQAPACSCGHDGSNARVVDLQDPVTGQTALHMAAANGEEEIAKFLIQKGARHLANNMGNTPLHWAVTNQKLAIVKLLLDSSSPPSDSASASSSGASSSGASSSGASSSGASSSGAAASPPSAGAFVVDVLAQNKVGKSAISEGFNAGNMEILQLLLEHYSAKALEETYQPASQSREDAGEALSEASSVGAAVPGTPSRPTLTERSPGSADACAAASCLVQEVTHAIQLGAPTARQRRPEAAADNARKATENGEKVPRTKGEEGTGEEDEESVIIKCREIGLDWTGQAFGDNAATDDTTGLHLWSAAVIGAQWMAELSKKGRFAGASVLELGAGCGLMGLAAALHAPEALSVFVQSDVFPHTLRNLEKGLSANGFSRGKGDTWTKAGRAQRACILALDWTETRTWPRVAEGSPKREAFERDGEERDGEEKETLQQFDFILGSDLLYDRKMLPPLVEVVASLLKKPAGTFYYVHRLHRQGAGEFVDALRRRGLKCEERSPPEEYFSNPFVDKTYAEAELHLPEFSSRDFVMVRCAWR